MMTRDYLHTEGSCASAQKIFPSCVRPGPCGLAHLTLVLTQLASCLSRRCDPWYGPRSELQIPYNLFCN